MPRYFFQLHDDTFIPDPDGVELPDVEGAREMAETSALDLMCGMLRTERRLPLHHRIEVEDEQHKVVATVRFSNLVKVEG